MKPIDVFRSGDMDKLCELLETDVPRADMEELYTTAEWAEGTLTRVTSVRVDHDEAADFDVPLILFVVGIVYYKLAISTDPLASQENILFFEAFVASVA